MHLIAVTQSVSVGIRKQPRSSHGDFVVVGDYEGYLHWIGIDDGEFAARTKVGGKGFTGMSTREEDSVEYLHAATLLHDDLVDGAGIRRGRTVAHQVWDNPTAVLAGDFLLARGLSIAADSLSAVKHAKVKVIRNKDGLPVGGRD